MALGRARSPSPARSPGGTTPAPTQASQELAPILTAPDRLSRTAPARQQPVAHCRKQQQFVQGGHLLGADRGFRFGQIVCKDAASTRLSETVVRAVEQSSPRACSIGSKIPQELNCSEALAVVLHLPARADISVGAILSLPTSTPGVSTSDLSRRLRRDMEKEQRGNRLSATVCVTQGETCLRGPEPGRDRCQLRVPDRLLNTSGE